MDLILKDLDKKLSIPAVVSATWSSPAVTSSTCTRKIPTTGQMMDLRRKLIVKRRRRGTGRGGERWTGYCKDMYKKNYE